MPDSLLDGPLYSTDSFSVRDYIVSRQFLPGAALAAVMFVRTQRKAQALSDELATVPSLSVAMLTGATPREDRVSILAGWQAKDFDILVITYALGEGIALSRPGETVDLLFVDRAPSVPIHRQARGRVFRLDADTVERCDYCGLPVGACDYMGLRHDPDQRCRRCNALVARDNDGDWVHIVDGVILVGCVPFRTPPR